MSCNNNNCVKGIVRVHNVFLFCPVCSNATLDQPPVTLEETDRELPEVGDEDAV